MFMPEPKKDMLLIYVNTCHGKLRVFRIIIDALWLEISK